MCAVLISLLAALTSTLRTRVWLQVEILALRHELHVFQRPKRKRVPLRTVDRLLWAIPGRLWPEWRKTLLLVRPDMVISWHRSGFRLYWMWKSRRGRGGRRGTPQEIRTLIRNMSSTNMLWAAPRVHGELAKFGIEVSHATAAKYMLKHRKPPSQTWRAFLENHIKHWSCRLLHDRQ